MPLLPVPDGVVADRFEDRCPSTELLLLGINNEADGLGIRWSISIGPAAVMLRISMAPVD